MFSENQKRIGSLVIAATLAIVALVYSAGSVAAVAGMFSIEKTAFGLLFKHVFPNDDCSQDS